MGQSVQLWTSGRFRSPGPAAQGLRKTPSAAHQGGNIALPLPDHPDGGQQFRVRPLFRQKALRPRRIPRRSIRGGLFLCPCRACPYPLSEKFTVCFCDAPFYYYCGYRWPDKETQGEPRCLATGPPRSTPGSFP